MEYFKIGYFLYLLPAGLILYQLCPRRFRYLTLLLMSLFYMKLFTRAKIMLFTFAATLIIYGCGLLIAHLKKIGKDRLKGLDKDEKKLVKAKNKRREKAVCACGILLVLSILLYLKYYNFFAENVNGISGRELLRMKDLIMPLGISFYTLSAIGYLADVYWEKVEAQKNPLKLLLFIMFFPTIMEGPIMPYTDVHEEMFAGKPLNTDNLAQGYIRIFWGLFKKIVIADRLYLIVKELFTAYENYSGAYIAAAAIIYTTQLYMEFSGCIDIVIGSAKLFNITLPENFRQPFLAKDASEFWRRWHMSLGVWFKNYIFYPVSMSKPAKKLNKRAGKQASAASKHLTHVLVSAMALLPVWLSNGLWHGARWTYICYGIYYFVIILLEVSLEPLRAKAVAGLHITDETVWYKWVRRAKTWLIIFTGELFFRADSLKQGFAMYRSMFGKFSIPELFRGSFMSMGLDIYDWAAVALGLITVAVVGYFREKHTDLSDFVAKRRLPLRWAVYIGLILAVIMLGAYGPGHEEVDMIYAGF